MKISLRYRKVDNSLACLDQICKKGSQCLSKGKSQKSRNKPKNTEIKEKLENLTKETELNPNKSEEEKEKDKAVGKLEYNFSKRIFINQRNIQKVIHKIITNFDQKKISEVYLLIPDIPNFPVYDFWILEVTDQGELNFSVVQVTSKIERHWVEYIDNEKPKTESNMTTRSLANIPSEKVANKVRELSDKHHHNVLFHERKCGHKPCQLLRSLKASMDEYSADKDDKKKFSSTFYWFTNVPLSENQKLQDKVCKHSRIIYLNENRASVGLPNLSDLHEMITQEHEANLDNN